MSLKSVKSLASKNWHDTAILFITTHGLIIKEDEEHDVDTFIVPKGITIKRAMVSAPGECNIVSEEIVDSYVKLINSLKTKLMSNRETTQDDAIKKIVDTIKRTDSSNLHMRRTFTRNLLRQKEKEELNESDEEHLENYQGYIRQFEKGFTIQEFNTGDQILNKKYLRENVESTKNDWVIKVMNIPGQPDLLSFLKMQTRGGESTIRLQEIVDFLIEKGVKNIIIFDLTCSNITYPDLTEFSKRETRSTRRSVRERKIGGKSIKHKKTKKYRKSLKKRYH
jgi:hypothetical protein